MARCGPCSIAWVVRLLFPRLPICSGRRLFPVPSSGPIRLPQVHRAHDGQLPWAKGSGLGTVVLEYWLAEDGRGMGPGSRDGRSPGISRKSPMEAGNQAKPSQPDRDGPHGLFSPIRRRHGGRPGVFGSRGRVRLLVCPVFDTGVAGVVFSHSIVVFFPIKSFFYNNIIYFVSISCEGQMSSI